MVFLYFVYFLKILLGFKYNFPNVYISLLPNKRDISK